MPPFAFFRPGTRSRIAFSPDDGGDGQSNTQSSTTTSTNGDYSPAGLLNDPEIEGQLSGFVRKQGSASRALEDLWNQTKKKREQVRTLDDEVTRLRNQLQEARDRAESSVSADDLKLLEAVRPLGTAEEIARKVQERDEAIQKSRRLESIEGLRRAAAVEEVPVDAVVELLGSKGFTWDLRDVEVEVDGEKQTVKRGVAVEKDDSGNETVRTLDDVILSVSPVLGRTILDGAASEGSAATTKTTPRGVQQDAITRTQKKDVDLGRVTKTQRAGFRRPGKAAE